MIQGEQRIVDDCYDFHRFAATRYQTIYCTMSDGSIGLVNEGKPLDIMQGNIVDYIPEFIKFDVFLLPEEKINFDLRIFFKSKKVTVLTTKNRDRWGYIFDL
jgi:hypothetical protein